MKNPRHYLLAVCALAIGCSLPSLRAEDPATPPPAKKEGGLRGDREEKMKERLGLTSEQADKIKAIHAEERAQLEALRAKEGEPKEKRAEMRAIREATKAKVDAVLTAEQRAKRNAMMEKREDRLEGKGDKPAKDGKGPKGPPGGE